MNRYETLLLIKKILTRVEKRNGARIVNIFQLDSVYDLRREIQIDLNFVETFKKISLGKKVIDQLSRKVDDLGRSKSNGGGGMI